MSFVVPEVPTLQEINPHVGEKHVGFFHQPVHDLKKPAGREIMYRLVEKSDVFLSNMGIELLESWDLGYEKLSAINPRLVYATNTGYGRFGAVSKPSFDMTVQALTGIMARLGEPEQPPIYLGMGSGDAYGGLMSALGIMLALYHRNRTGKGQMLDASLYGAQLFLTAPTLQAVSRHRQRHVRQAAVAEDGGESAVEHRIPAKDKWLFLCVPNTDANWSRLCQSLDDAGLASDAALRQRGETPPQRQGADRAARQDHQATQRRRVDGALDSRSASSPARSTTSPISPPIRRPGRMTTSSRPTAKRCSAR